MDYLVSVWLSASIYTRCFWLLPDSLVKHSSPPLGICWLLRTLPLNSSQDFTGAKETELTQNERTCCLGYFGLLCHCSAPSTDWLFGAEAARYWGKTPFTSLLSPALQSPSERKLPGTGQRQWNADVGKSWGKCWKIQLSEMYRDNELLVWVMTELKMHLKSFVWCDDCLYDARKQFAQNDIVKKLSFLQGSRPGLFTRPVLSWHHRITFIKMIK